MEFRRTILMISIHALREEGDERIFSVALPPKNFYPRPPRGGRHTVVNPSFVNILYFYPRPPRGGRLEGGVNRGKIQDFYPRPPRGGRHLESLFFIMCFIFLSTPSARRATTPHRTLLTTLSISIHALREEGDN